MNKKRVVFLINLFVLIICTIVVSAQSQNPPLERAVSIEFKNERTDEALKKLSQLGGFTFSYSASAFDVQKVITKKFVNKTIREILEEIFEGTVKFKQKNNYIILTKAEVADGIVVSGYVVDESTGKKLKEVSVYDPVSLRSTVTDEFGYFQLEVKKPTAEEMQLAIKKNNYTDTLVVVPSKRSTFQQFGINVDEEKWKIFSDSVDSKLNKLWIWTKQSAQSINMHNIRDTINRTWQVSFVPFAGTNHKLSGNIVNDYSLNVLGGYSGGTRVAEVGGLFNIDRGDVKKFQLAGLFNLNGGYTQGVQVAGLFNTNLDRTTAVQIAGLANVTIRRSEGAQVAGLLNVSTSDFLGSQVAGLFNTTFGNVEGAQVAGLFNFSTKKTQGAQVAGLLNVGNQITGSQVSSLVNVGKTVLGAQIGLLNVADSLAGVPIGLLSFVNKGYHKIEIAADEVLPLNFSFRTGVTQFYNILTVGILPDYKDTVTWSFGYGFGSAPRLTRWLSLNVDVTANQLSRGRVEALNMINKFYLGFDIHLSKKLSLLVGATANLRIYDSEFDKHATTFTYYKPDLLEESKFSNSTNYQTWFGWKVGVRFL